MNEKLLFQFIKYCPNAAAVFDRNMVYLACSDRHLRDYNLSSEQVIGKNHYEVFPELPQKWRDVHQRALRGSVERNNQDWFTRPDGSICYVNWECRPWHDLEGEIGGIILYSDVITEQLRVLQQAKNQAERDKKQLEIVLSHIDSGVAAFDIKGNFVHGNNMLAKILGFRDKTEVPKNADFFERSYRLYSYPEHNAIPHDKWPLDRLFRGETVENEKCIIHHLATGQKRIIEYYGVPIYDPQGNLELGLLMLKDITEQEEHDKQNRLVQERLAQTQRLESLGVLAGGIAHDFNNLLMAILGHADIALEKLAQPSPIKEDLSDIKMASLRAADLCTQLLAYSGQGKLEEQAFSLSRLTSEMVQMLKTSIAKNCILDLSLEEQQPLMNGDISQLRQVLMNFVINASDAIGDGQGTIRITTASMNFSREDFTDDYLIKPVNSGRYVTLEVTDDGPGMNKETLARIFEPFFSTKFTGRGLGLSAVLGIIRSHSGGLKVSSSPGVGTSFKVLFPASHATQDAPLREEHLHPGKKRFSGKVLLVDDEEIVLNVCTSQLELLGLEVLIARDGHEGVELYRAKQAEIDLVILDLTMPRKGGEETFHLLRQLNPEVKVILASGFAEAEVINRFAQTKLAGYLRKPYTLKQLAQLLSALLPDGS